MVMCKLAEPLKAIGRKVSVIRVAGTGWREIAIRRPLETLRLCAAACLGSVEIVAKVLLRLAFHHLPAAFNDVSALFTITYTVQVNDIMDRNVGYVG
jgi:hypothetical protein